MTTLVDDLVAARTACTSDTIKSWYSPKTLDHNIRKNVEQEASWVGDAEFGAMVRDLVATVDVPDPLAWANRRVDLPDGNWCVTGIRFRDRDVTRPFIDIIAATVPLTPKNLAEICSHVAPLHADFNPRAVRVLVPEPDALIADVLSTHTVKDAVVDQYLVAGLVKELSSRPALPGFERISLAPTTAELAKAKETEILEALFAEYPQMRQWTRPTALEDFQDCLDAKSLFQIVVDGTVAGVIAADRQDNYGMSGFVVQHIILDAEHRGQRLAGVAMQQLIKALSAKEDDVLWGTIHPDNKPSLRNALSVGRKSVGGYVWLMPEGMLGMA